MAAGTAAAAREQRSLGVSGDELELGYRTGPIVADLARAGAGLVLVLTPLVMLTPSWPVALGLLGLAALFAVFLHQSWRRRGTRVRITEEGIELVGEQDRRLAWRELDLLRLRWFGPRRQGAGWLDLELRGAGKRIAVTSGLEGFDLVLGRALAAAERNGVVLEAVTQANVAAVLREAERAALKDPAGSSAPRG